MLIDAIYDLVGGSDPVSVLQSVVFALVAIVVALTLHEFAHAAVASLCGDKTSKAQGRLSLNPLNHIDPVGFLMLFVFGFGWAKPVNIRPARFRHPRLGCVLTAAAGPLCNLLQAFIFAFPAYLLSVEAQTYKFEVFEGPLDLLLSLIEKHKIDIYDIKISLLLEQYMLYIKEAKERNWDLTADFIEMAARLMYIKSYSLLPPKEGDEEEEDPKLDLERMLRAYAKYKQLSEQMREDYIGNKIFFRDVRQEGLPKPPQEYNYEAERLEKIYRRLMIKYSAKTLSSRSFQALIGTKVVSVGSRIVYVEERLSGGKPVMFHSLFTSCKSRSEIVATFLAVLELLRNGRIDMEDDGDDIALELIEE